MKNLLFCVFLLLPMLSQAQIRLSLGESKDSITIPSLLHPDGSLVSKLNGHALYSYKAKTFECHIVKIDKEFFFCYNSSNELFISGKVTQFNITRCEINVEAISASHGKITFKEECGVLIRLFYSGELKYMHDYYRSYSDVIFKENVNQYFHHRYFKIQ